MTTKARRKGPSQVEIKRRSGMVELPMHQQGWYLGCRSRHPRLRHCFSGIPNATLNGAEEVLWSTRPRGNQGQERGTGHKRIANALMGSSSPSNPSGLPNSSHRLHPSNPFKPSIHFIHFNYPIQPFSLNQPQSASPITQPPSSSISFTPTSFNQPPSVAPAEYPCNYSHTYQESTTL